MGNRLLFIIGSLDSGGVSKSMISLLQVIDKEAYDVSLLVTNPQGLFMDFLPKIKNIRVITDKKMACLFQRWKGLRELFRMGYWGIAVANALRMCLSKINRGYAGWLLSRLMPALKERFDVIVDYGGQHQLYYMVDKLHAKKKMTFFHSDYSRWDYYYDVDKFYYKKIDKVFTISEICLKSLIHYFPYLVGKVKVMENISSCQLIEELAQESITDVCFPKGKQLFLTVGHVCLNKGTDFAIEAMNLLKDKHRFDFVWYFVGDVRPDSIAFSQEMLKRIEKYGLEENVCFLGTRINPYPYIKRADLYIHPSRFEGKSIALDEAKILCKPIVVTNFSTVTDQFVDGYNASICEMSPQSLADAIEDLVVSKEKREKYVHNLDKDKKDNSDAINVLYKAIQGR